MKTLGFYTFFCLMVSLLGASRASALGLGVDPIIGYERDQKLVPTEHTKDRLVYGLRVTLGVPLLSAEAEYTHGTDSEIFTSPDLTTRDTTEKAKLGLRSELALSAVVHLIGRGGVQASSNKHEEITAAGTSIHTEPIEYKPYAGAGLSASLSGKITASAEVVAVFKDWPHMNKNEYQTTVGLSVHIP